MSQHPHKPSSPPAEFFVPPTPRTIYCPIWRFDLHLFDFDPDFALPPNAGETISHPMNLNVHSAVADQAPAYAESSRLPFLREDRWHISNPRLTHSIFPADPTPSRSPGVVCSGVAQAPPAPRYNPDLARWLLGREPFSRHRLEPPRHHYAGPRQRHWRRLLRDLTLDIPYADVAHEVCLRHIVMRWYVIQVVGPRYAPVRVCWARRPGGSNFIFRQFVPGNRPNPPVRDLSHELINEVDHLTAAMEMYERNPEAEADTLLFFERYLCWLSQVGASVRFSQYYLDLLDRAMRVAFPAFSEVQRQDELTRLRGELLMRNDVPYVIPSLNQPITRIRTIETKWEDPRCDDRGLPSDQPHVFESDGMAKLFDFIAHVGINGPGERVPAVSNVWVTETGVRGGEEPPDYLLTSAALEGDELDAFVLEQGEDPRNVFGATIPVPPRTPTPSPSPVPMCAPTPVPSPPTASGGEMDVDEDFISIPPASPPPDSFEAKIPSRKRHRARVESEEDEEDSRPPRREILGNIPVPVAHPSLHRPVVLSVVLRRLGVMPSPLVDRAGSHPRPEDLGPRPVSGCERIPRLLVGLPHPDLDFSPIIRSQRRLASPGIQARRQPPSNTKGIEQSGPWLGSWYRVVGAPRRTCKRCFNAHETCEAWGEFYAAYTDQDEVALGRFLFEYWEHLGNGVYQLLHPDNRLSDLYALAREFPYRVFLYRFLPLQNTRRSFKRRGDGHRPLVPTRAQSPASRSASPAPSRSLSMSSGSPSPVHSVLGDNPLDYDLEDEPAPPPSQQASSSRVPSYSSRSSTMAGSTPRPDTAEADESLSSLADLLRHSQAVSPEEAAARDAAQFSAILDSQPAVDRERFLAYMRGVLDGVAQSGSSSGNASSSDPKGKGHGDPREYGQEQPPYYGVQGFRCSSGCPAFLQINVDLHISRWVLPSALGRLGETAFGNPSRDFTLVDNPDAPDIAKSRILVPQSMGRGAGLLAIRGSIRWAF
ncbi:hypothetical protein DFH06DRAFT_1346638 [Mycena polygramma]|nr:hypothetical protein DFH06DRAFT_1346638 [Mycena polygramma]